VGIVSERYYVGFVVMDAKFMGVSFVYVYDRRERRLIEHKTDSITRPLAVSRDLYDGVTHYTTKGYRLSIENSLRHKHHDVTIDIAARKGLPAITGRLRIHEDQQTQTPLVLVTRIDGGGPMYTHKNITPVEGSLRVGTTSISFDAVRDLAMLDVQKTAYPYRSFWKWVSIAGRDILGTLIGVNLCVNDRKDDEELNENCVWIDGRIHPLGSVRLEYERYMDEWRITTSCGTLDLRFVPETERCDRINALAILSDFHQVLGHYHGTISLPDEVDHSLEGMFGIAEHHVMRW